MSFDRRRVVAIVGPFRSGTSLVAAVIHRLGWPVATSIIVPAPPNFRSDWEDLDLTVPLMRGETHGRQWFAAYMGKRVQTSVALGFEGRVAVKCAYLALHWEAFLAAQEAAPFVIRTYRDEIDRQVSVKAHPALSLKDDTLLVRAISRIAPDASIGCEWAQKHPEACARILAEHLGVTDDAAIAAAAALIGQPTRY